MKDADRGIDDLMDSAEWLYRRRRFRLWLLRSLYAAHRRLLIWALRRRAS